MVTSSLLLSIYIILNYKNSLQAKYPLMMASLILVGLLYKESAFTLLPILLSFLYLYKDTILNIKTWIAGVIFPFIIYFILRIPIAERLVQSPHYSPISEATLAERFLTIPKVLFHYVGLFFYPHILSVSQHFVVKDLSLVNFFIPLIFITGILISLIYFYKNNLATKDRKTDFIFAFIWMIFGFGMISNIVPLDMTVAERWFYFPIIGMILLCNLLLIELKENQKKYSLLVLAGFIGFFMLISFSRNLDWKNGYTLYSADIKVNPESFDLSNNVGVELFRVGQKDEAKFYFEKSIGLQPKWHFAYNNLGVVYDDKGELQKAEELFKKTLENSDYHLAHINLCRLYTIKMKDFQKAEESCDLSARKLPDNLQLWFYLAIAKYQNNKQAEALQLAQALVQRAPSNETKYVLEKISKKEKLEF